MLQAVTINPQMSGLRGLGFEVIDRSQEIGYVSIAPSQALANATGVQLVGVSDGFKNVAIGLLALVAAYGGYRILSKRRRRR